jgi:hypothetical protein
MESVSKITIFFEFILLHGKEEFAENLKFSNKNNHLPASDFKINFSRPLFTIIFRQKIVILDTDSILRVQTIKVWTEGYSEYSPNSGPELAI